MSDISSWDERNPDSLELADLKEVLLLSTSFERVLEIYEKHLQNLSKAESELIVIAVILNSHHSKDMTDRFYADLDGNEKLTRVLGLSGPLNIGMLKKFQEDGKEALLSIENRARLLFLKAAEESGVDYVDFPIDWMVRVISKE